MVIHRFYCESIKGSAVELTDQEARHLFGVLRLKVEDRAELFDGKGTLAQVTIRTVSNKKISLEIDEIDKHEKKHTAEIIIAASIAKGERFDWLISKCTELGVDRIVPTIFERTVKQPKNPKILDRWKNLTIASAKQCKRLYLPQIDPPEKLADVIAEFKETKILYGSLDAKAVPLTNLNFENKNMVAFIGPEGGFTDEETAMLDSANAQPVSLTDTVLRIETAAVAFASILAAQRNAI